MKYRLSTQTCEAVHKCYVLKIAYYFQVWTTIICSLCAVLLYFHIAPIKKIHLMQSQNTIEITNSKNLSSTNRNNLGTTSFVLGNLFSQGKNLNNIFELSYDWSKLNAYMHYICILQDNTYMQICQSSVLPLVLGALDVFSLFKCTQQL